MKKLLVAVMAVATLASCNNGIKKVSSLNSELDSVSYSLGVDMANKLKNGFPEVSKDLLVQGYVDAMDSVSLLVPRNGIDKQLSAYFSKTQQRRQEKAAIAKYGDIKEQGVKFLEENKSKEGVVTTDSGLQYIVLKEGTGETPEGPTANVEVHYHGTTPDGTVFDSSVDRKKSISFALNRVIKGWTEGVQLMKEGAKYKFFIPQELAYGANAPQGGSGPIKPFMPLIFEVELIKINK
ncbi:MAG: peptidylprolyl isomerase [Flavobacteriaceae bacterium]|nr:MAG: peptidylprolyl isomerase [Flavobacteriaceae bacterium]